MGPRIGEGVKFHPFPWLRYCTLTFAKALQRCIFTTHDHICNIFLQSLASPAHSHLGTRASLRRAKKAVKTCPAPQPTSSRRRQPHGVAIFSRNHSQVLPTHTSVHAPHFVEPKKPLRLAPRPNRRPPTASRRFKLQMHAAGAGLCFQTAPPGGSGNGTI